MPFLDAATTAAADPAGGAAIDQVVIATGSAMLALAGLWLLVTRYRAGRARRFAELAEFSERVSGLPAWAAVPTAVSAGALVIALLGMYWDIALHVGDGRDAGPLANPAHYLILVGLFGVFAAGVLAIAMPRDATPGPAAVTLAPGWSAPVGGLLMASCGAFALAGFPLDDFWHRLFGQDVTLWGPTHLMLIGGAGMTLIGQAVLVQEGLRARPQPAPAEGGWLGRFAVLRQVALMGGLLIGLSTFQAEFDFGVPQFRAVNQPAMIALAAAVALVAARVWIGRGAALGAAVFFLVVRGTVALVVGPVFGETTPSMPLYLGEALAVEAAALAIGRRRPLLLGAIGGLLVGTVGFATAWGWTQVAMKLPWEPAILPEALIAAAIAGTAGGVIGGLTGAALRGALPRPAVARLSAGAAALVLVLVVANGLYETAPPPVRAAMTVEPAGEPGRGDVTVRLDPADAADDAAWLSVTSWQGGGLVVDRLRRGVDGSWRTRAPVPVAGAWKTTLRLHAGRAVFGAPIWLPEDPAIPVEAVELPRAGEPRGLVPDRTLLQRELKGDIPGWLWGGASALVLALALGFLGTLAWGLGRVARHAKAPDAPLPPGPRADGRFRRARSGAATA